MPQSSTMLEKQQAPVHLPPPSNIPQSSAILSPSAPSTAQTKHPLAVPEISRGKRIRRTVKFPDHMSGEEFINAMKEKQANEAAEKERKKIRAQELIEKKRKTEENKILKRDQMAKKKRERELEKVRLQEERKIKKQRMEEEKKKKMMQKRGNKSLKSGLIPYTN